MPKNTAVPSAWRISAPAPVANTSGTHAEDEGEGGHQDRAQAGAARRAPRPRRRLLAAPPRAAWRTRRSGWRSWRRARSARQADLGQDVVVHAANSHAGHRGQQAHRHDQDDRQRQQSSSHTAPPAPGRRTPPRRRRHADRGVAGELLLVGELGPFEAEAGGQQPRPRAAPSAASAWPDEKPGVVSPWTSAAGIEVVARHAVGAGRVAEGRDRAQRHHLAARRCRVFRLAMSRDARAGTAPSACAVHPVGAAQVVEVVDVGRAQIDVAASRTRCSAARPASRPWRGRCRRRRAACGC